MIRFRFTGVESLRSVIAAQPVLIPKPAGLRWPPQSQMPSHWATPALLSCVRRAAGGHDTVFGLTRQGRSWAITRAASVAEPAIAFAIESAAYDGGVPMAGHRGQVAPPA